MSQGAGSWELLCSAAEGGEGAAETRTQVGAVTVHSGVMNTDTSLPVASEDELEGFTSSLGSQMLKY